MAKLVKIKIEVTRNEALTTVDGSRSTAEEWAVDHDKPQVLEVSVSTVEEQLTEVDATGETTNGSLSSDLGEKGDKIGIVQTLVKSKRIAKYEGGGKLHIIPEVELPCLDGRPEMPPWYDTECSGPNGEALPAVGRPPIVFRMSDNPENKVPGFGVQGNLQYDIEQLRVEEAFLVSLYNKTRRRIIKQWEWTYDYTVTAGANGRPAPNLISLSGIAITKRPNEIEDIGQTPNEGRIKGWTHGYDHPDPTWADQSE